MKHELRYLVVKYKDICKHLSEEEIVQLDNLAGKVVRGRSIVDGKDSIQCVVVEHDWPEYETVWKMIEDRVDGKQSTITSLQAQLAERDKTILEQQESAYKDAKIIRKHLETIDEYQRIAYQQRDGRLSALEKVAALESALKAERLAGKIEGLEEAAEWHTHEGWLLDESDVPGVLRRLAAELKEGK